jgi:hypothetical protein
MEFGKVAFKFFSKTGSFETLLSAAKLIKSSTSPNEHQKLTNRN